MSRWSWLLGALALTTLGCQSLSPRASTQTSTRVASAPAPKGRAQIWAETCMRCHNMRSPSNYTDAQWDVVVHHMRVRGYLTTKEARAIEEFLKASN